MVRDEVGLSARVACKIFTTLKKGVTKMPLQRNIDVRELDHITEAAVIKELTWLLEYELDQNKLYGERTGADEELCKAVALVLKHYVDKDSQDEVDLLLNQILGD